MYLAAIGALGTPIYSHALTYELDEGGAGPWIGAWTKYDLAQGWRGDVASTTQAGDTFTYSFANVQPGAYDVSVWYASNGSLPDNAAPVTIKHASGSQVVSVNQQINQGKWNRLGTWTFGNTASVVITNRGVGKVIADGVKLETATISPPTGQSANGATVPPAAQIVDSNGDVWTLTTNGQIAKNGTVDAPTGNVVLLLYYNNKVYQKISINDLWWYWSGTAWVATTDPRSTTSPAPTLSFTANPTQVTTGASAQLSWSSQNASSCSASGAWSGTKNTSGTQTVSNLTADQRYGLTCSGSGGSVSANATIAVVRSPHPSGAGGLKALAGSLDHFTWSGGVPSIAVDKMAAAGLQSIRAGMAWSTIEKQKGVYAWNEESVTRDAILAASARGMQPLGLLLYGNGLYPGVTSQEFRDGFARYATWIATQLKGKVRHYEVWNEWSGGMGVGPWDQYPANDPSVYTKLLCSTYAALKKVDPDITVLGGAVAYIHTSWIVGMMNAGAASCMDGLSVHPYQLYHLGVGAEATVSNLQALQNTIKPIVGREIPIYITEEGMSTYTGVPYEDQASHLSRYFLGTKTLPFIKGVWWYCLRDLTVVNDFQNNFGLMRPNYGTPKPAYYALQDVVGLFSKADYLGKVKSPSDIWALKFREPDGSYAYALWSTGSVSTKTLVFDTSGSGALSMQKVSSNPALVTNTTFNTGQNTASVSVSKMPIIIRSSGVNVNLSEVK